MDKSEYLAALNELGVSSQKVAWLFTGKSRRSGRRWAREGAPYHVALLLTLMQEFGLTPDYIEVLGRQWRKGDNNGKDEEDEEDEEGQAEQRAQAQGGRRGARARAQGRQA
jgi:hypothetical protein